MEPGNAAAACGVVVVVTTFGDRAGAERVARALVEEGLAACITILAPALSIYRWQGRVESAEEHPLLIKAAAAGWPALRDRLRALHPYELPEIVALPVADGLADYLAWVRAESGG